MVEEQCKDWFSLTVAESKRLIAQGLKLYAPVVEKLERGTVLITKGTTARYLYEEFSGKSIANGDYVYGHILPARAEQKLQQSKPCPELVLKDGGAHPVPFPQVLQHMTDGDIIFKGANVINYHKGQAGLMIQHPTGGTYGLIVPAVEQQNLRLIIPVGLEKDSSEDISLLAEHSKTLTQAADGSTPCLWALDGELFTEIEALHQMADVEVQVLGKGGVGGAEGAVTFCISGSKVEVMKAMNVINNIQGEESYVK